MPGEAAGPADGRLEFIVCQRAPCSKTFRACRPAGVDLASTLCTPPTISQQGGGRGGRGSIRAWRNASTALCTGRPSVLNPSRPLPSQASAEFSRPGIRTAQRTKVLAGRTRTRTGHRRRTQRTLRTRTATCTAVRWGNSICTQEEEEEQAAASHIHLLHLLGSTTAQGCICLATRPLTSTITWCTVAAAVAAAAAPMMEVVVHHYHHLLQRRPE